jgi:hypothetical protein
MLRFFTKVWVATYPFLLFGMLWLTLIAMVALAICELKRCLE